MWPSTQFVVKGAEQLITEATTFPFFPHKCHSVFFSCDFVTMVSSELFEFCLTGLVTSSLFVTVGQQLCVKYGREIR